MKLHRRFFSLIIILFQIAIKAYYCLVMTGDFTSLGLSSIDDNGESIKMHLFIIELSIAYDGDWHHALHH
jgi:hypothetical protein